MASSSIRFFATTDDIFEILSFLFATEEFRVFEAYSAKDQSLREFISVEELEVHRLNAQGNQGYIFLQLIAPAVTTGPMYRRIVGLAGAGFTCRYTVEDPSMIKLLQGTLMSDTKGRPLSRSEISHWSEAGARQRSLYSPSVLDQIDWRELRRLSGKIQRHIRNKLAVAKYNSWPILKNAYTEMREGLLLWGEPGLVGIDSPGVIEK